MKQTRKVKLKIALFSSMMSLLLCCVMLIGTTYAWMTETVNSGENRIIAGILDVELLTWEKTDSTQPEYAYTKISNASSALFEKTVWEAGDEDSVNLAVKNTGNLDFEYDMVLVVKDAGMAEYLEYKLEDESGQDQDIWYSLATASNAVEPQTGFSLLTIAEDHKLVGSENETVETVSGISEAEETADEVAETAGESIERFTLSVRMKSNIANAAVAGKNCEIDIRIIATQLVETDSASDETDESGTLIMEINLSDDIYHFATLEIVSEDAYDSEEDSNETAENGEEIEDTETSEDSEPEYVSNYMTAESVTAKSESGNVQIKLPKGMQVEAPSASNDTEKRIVISVSATSEPDAIQLETKQTAQTVNVRFYGISEDNETAYTLMQVLSEESNPVKVVYTRYDGNELDEMVESEVLTEESDDINLENTEFQCSYDAENHILKIKSIYQGQFTVICKLPEE